MGIQAQAHLRHVYAHVGRPCHRRLCLAFAGVGPMQLKPSASSSRAALRAVGPSMKIGVFYGTSTGNTEGVASRIAAKIGADKCEDIGSIEPSAFAEYDTLIVGAPTWHTGEEKEGSGTDWDSVIYQDLPSMDSAAKRWPSLAAVIRSHTETTSVMLWGSFTTSSRRLEPRSSARWR